MEMLERGHHARWLVSLAPDLLHVGMPIVGGRLRQLGELAEVAGERLVLFGSQLLATEHDDQKVFEREHHLRQGRLVQGLRDIDPANLTAAGTGQRLDLDALEIRHGPSRHDCPLRTRTCDVLG
jgi:hypothetical protein